MHRPALPGLLSALLVGVGLFAASDARPAAADGALQVSDKPSPQQLLERAQYWESHGRSDIAAQIRARLQYLPAGNSVSRAPAVAPQPVERRVPHTVPQSNEVATAPRSTAASPASNQELARQAQYWEAHGRDDLASQIRQKLQRLAPAAPAAAPAPAVTRAAPSLNSSSHAALESSLLNAPDSLDTRLDLAQVYRGAGNPAKARALIDGVLSSKPQYPAALLASARLYADQHQWRESLSTLEKIRPAARTPEMANLQKMAWAHVQLDRADALVSLGRNAEARLLLRRVALELSINTGQPSLAEPPPLWKPAHPKAADKGRKR